MKEFLLITLIMFSSFFVNAQKLPVQTSEPGAWLKDWLLVGPIPLEKKSETLWQWGKHIEGFETDYLKSVGGELNPKLTEGIKIKTGKGKTPCKYYQSPDSIVNLDLALTKERLVLAYGYTEFESKEAKTRILSLGSSDGCRVWLNGEQIWDISAKRRIFADDDMIPVALKKGKNTLLIKVEERGSSWGFCARLLPFSWEKLNNKGDIFLVLPQTDSTVQLKSIYPENVLNRFIDKTEVELYSEKGEQVIKETWQNRYTGSLSLPTSSFRGYILNLKNTLKTGEIISREIKFNAGKRITYPLFSEGKSDYRIMLADDASESEKWAAGELQHWIQKVGNVKIPVETLDLSYKGPKIIVGFNELTKQKTNADEPGAGDESFYYFNDGQDIVIYGGSDRGTMYGVMSFLENEMGCRWYTPSISVTPEKRAYTFEKLYHTEKPGIRVRDILYLEAVNPIWSARNRINGTFSSGGVTPQPGGTKGYWACHTLLTLVPPDEFYKTHPEYYCLIDGKRVNSSHAQLCLTNPDVLKIVIERMKKVIRENPDYLIYSVSQSDWRNPCQCDKCQALAKKEGSESGPIIWFVNQVAEAIEKEFPDKFIGTLAYQYSQKPPENIKPRKNVVVRLCSFDCCFSHDFQTCPENKQFYEDLKGWADISHQLYIWDYVVNFTHYMIPYPNFYVLQPNIKTLRDNKAIGIMEQGDYQSRGGEFAELRYYLIARLLWDPECDIQKVIDDFMYGYYGRAGKYVREYFEMLQSLVTPEIHIHLQLMNNDGLFQETFFSNAESIFKKAESVADNPEILRRVEMAELPVLYQKCVQKPEQAIYDGTYEKFKKIVKSEGITHYGEAGEKHKEEFYRNMESFKR